MFSLVKQFPGNPAAISFYESEDEALLALKRVRFDKWIDSVTLFDGGVAVYYAYSVDGETEYLNLVTGSQSDSL